MRDLYGGVILQYAGATDIFAVLKTELGGHIAALAQTHIIRLSQSKK